MRRPPAHPRPSPSPFVGRISCVTATVALLLALSTASNLPLDACSRFPAQQNLHLLQKERASNFIIDSSPPQSDRPTPSANPAKLVLTDGTPIRLRFVRAVDSSLVIAGETEPMEAVEAVLVGNFVAIPLHSPAQATVTLAQAKRNEGRGGNLQVKIESVRLADGELVLVRGLCDAKGGGHHTLIIGGAAAGIAGGPASPLLLLLYVKGKSAIIPAGAEITAYIIGDHPLDPSKFEVVSKNPEKRNGPQ